MKKPVQSGKVWLVGAGPGDPELLTLKAVRAIHSADVILIDDLANAAVLAHARPDVRVVRVGKRGGCRSTPQAFIEKLMIRFARAGATVVRIKGGDPFVFGRGGEEMLALRQAGVEHEIVPGISSGMAVPASIGIPVTHREFSRGVTFITGHTKAAEPNWTALANSGTTLVIYMGIGNLPRIQSALLEAGMPANMPACAIQNGTLVEAKRVITTLANIAEKVMRHGIASPAILVIGEVVSLATAISVVEPSSGATQMFFPREGGDPSSVTSSSDPAWIAAFAGKELKTGTTA